MKKTLLLFAAFLIFNYSNAQNMFPASGNVGIGTTSPASLLQVVGGTIRSDVGTNGGAAFVGNGGHSNFQVIHDLTPNVTLLNSGGGFNFATTSVSNALSISPAGNLGMGTNNPQSALQIGEYGVSSNNSITFPGSYNFEQVKLGETPNGNSALEFVNHWGAAASYGIKFLVDVDHGAPGLQIQYAPTAYSYSGLNYTTGLYMTVDGSISVGTLIHPAGYKFAVGGNLIAESITVKTQSNWPDYVFRTDYHELSLKDVKNYIDRNHHLPDIPSAQQIKEQGIDVGDMNLKLLRKVEELTLYLIQKDQEIRDLKQKFATFKKHIRIKD